MGTSDDLLGIIFESATILNGQRTPEQRIALEATTVLVGDGGRLDSLGLVSLLVMIEEAVEDKMGGECSLVDTLFNENSEDRIWTIADLVENISNELEAS